MKRINLLFLIVVLLGGQMMISCDKTNSTDPYEADYSVLTVEQHKQYIESEGVAVVAQLEGMSDLAAIPAIEDLVQCLNSGNMASESQAARVSKLMAPVLGLDQGYKALVNQEETYDEIDSISEMFASYAGIYTYDSENETWSYQASESEISFNFPIGTSSDNDGKLTIDNLGLVNSVNADITTELPTSLNITLTQNTTALFSFEFTAAYNSHSEPSNIKMVYHFTEGYTFEESFTNDGTDASLSFDFSKDDVSIASAGLTMNGSFSTSVMNDTEYEGMDEYAAAVLDAANAYVKVGNIKMAAKMEVDSAMIISNDIDNAYYYSYNTEQYVIPTESEVNTFCKRLNNNCKAVLVYTSDNTAICKSEFYTESYQSYVWDNETENVGSVTVYEPSLRFVFKDGSAMDDSFFDEGFDGLISAWNTFASTMESSYSGN
jgi:hypothetical protein